MRCLVCGADMELAEVVDDDTMPVAGFMRRTLSCPECGETEHRLVFAQVDHPPPESPACAERSDLVPSPSPADPPTSAPPLGAWAQAVERIRERQAMLAQCRPVAAASGIRAKMPLGVPQMPVPPRIDPPSARQHLSKEAFDLLWESLARDPQPASPDHAEARDPVPAPPAPRSEDRRASYPEELSAGPAPIAAAEQCAPPDPSDEPLASEALVQASGPAAAIEPPTAASRFARAMALFRGRRSTPTRKGSGAMLLMPQHAIPHLDDEALSAMPMLRRHATRGS